jgi:hypothetical protein
MWLVETTFKEYLKGEFRITYYSYLYSLSKWWLFITTFLGVF